MIATATNRPANLNTRDLLLGFILVLVLGIAVRIYPSTSFTGLGYDEALYRGYVNDLARGGITSYPAFAEHYVEVQTTLPAAILPPTRFLYIFSAYLWQLATHASALQSLHRISCLFSVLLFLLSGVFTWRMAGSKMALGVMALMSCAPTQIHMSQHALIDGYFAFWATLSLWLLWENLQRPNHPVWLTAYTLSLILLVITKENAMFVYIGLLALLGVNYWLKFGRVTKTLLLLTFIGPLAGVAVLVNLCGGADTFFHVYRLLVSKASVLPYAIATGDGPWYRYLLDLLLISPVILLLAWGYLFRLKLNDKESLYLLTFVCATYLVMCNVRYGMNLRYTVIWDMPLRFLAILSIRHLARSFSQHKDLIVVVTVSLVCAVDLRQYYIFFVQHDLYELVTGGLLHAVNILK